MTSGAESLALGELAVCGEEALGVGLDELGV